MGLIKQGESVADRRRRLASELINVKSLPSGFETMRAYASEARAYYELQPYPWYNFQDWKSEDRGPLPKCMPFTRTITAKSARWLFGKPVQISVPGNETLEQFLRRMWTLNRMGTRMVAYAEKAGYQGGLVLKWSYDATDDVPLRFQTLSPVDECRIFDDPHDKDRMVMLRIQYPFFVEQELKWYWHREEWTDEFEVHYFPQQDAMIGHEGFNPYDPPKSSPDEMEWQEEWRQENPFGVIPAMPVKNIETDTSYGAGDLWTLYRVIDRINLTYHLMDKSNQFDSSPNTVFIDVSAEQDDLESPLAPGQNVSLKSDNGEDGEKKRGEVKVLEARGSLRPAMMEYAKELKTMVMDAAGAVELRQDEITNKGNLTSAVLTQLYAPLVEMTTEKRKTYGDAICTFLERCALGLEKLGVAEAKAAAEESEGSYDVQLTWPPFFDMTPDEKDLRTITTAKQIATGFLTQERGIERIASIEGIDDVKVLESELEEKTQRLEDADKANADALIANAETGNEQPASNNDE